MAGLLRDADMRIVTLSGPGGSGKTRLALQVAWELRERFADGVIFIPLAPLHDPDLVIDAIAQACDIQANSELIARCLVQRKADRRSLWYIGYAQAQPANRATRFDEPLAPFRDFLSELAW